MDEQRDVWIGDQVQSFLRRRVGGHYYARAIRVRRGWQVGVVHESNMGVEVCASCEMKLQNDILESAHIML